ncbi:MAG: hypothetical protein K9J17_07890 [Flavobacteriales bacterium]|nr:hypothetical protein [Flavobacteriales bacterium]
MNIQSQSLQHAIETNVFKIAWAIVFLLAIVYKQERLYADASYYLFHTINQGFPQVDHQRFVLAISELLPLLGSYLGLSLSALILLYSVGHVLFSYLLFHNIYFTHRSAAHGLFILLLQFTAYTNLFFSPMLELWYGLILLVWLDHRLSIGKIHGWKNQLLLLTISTSILFSHPENFIGFLLILVYRWNTKQLPVKQLGAAIFLMVAVVLFKFATFSDYEAGKVTNAQQNSEQGISELLEPAYLTTLVKMLVINYYDCLLYLMIGAFIFVRKGLKAHAFIIVLFAIGFVVFINLTLHRNEFGRYSESCYLPLTFICLFCISMAWNYLDPKWKSVIGSVIIIFSAIRLNDIRQEGNTLKERTIQMSEFVDLARADHAGKMILLTENITTEFTRIGWSYPIESLLLSAMQSPDSAVSIIFDEDYLYDQNVALSNASNFILRRYELLELSEVNDRYFVLPNSIYSYSVIRK